MSDRHLHAHTMSHAHSAHSAHSQSLSEKNKAVFLEKVRESNAACQAGDFDLAVRLYSEAIALDPANHILYSNRSAAHVKMGQFVKALHDATKARELNPEWPKVRKTISEFACPSAFPIC